MSQTLSVYAIFVALVSFLDRSSTASFEKPVRDMCAKSSYSISHGNIHIQGSMAYQLRCKAGFVVPWGFPNQSHEYKCNDTGGANYGLPRGCIEEKPAYQRLQFGLLVYLNKEGGHICKRKEDLSEIQQDFNLGAMPKPRFMHHSLYKGQVSSCTIVNASHSLLMFTINGVTPRNKTREDVEDVYAQIILKAYDLLKYYIAKRGYSYGDKRTSHTLNAYNNLIYYKGDRKIVGYDCDKSRGHRIDGGRHVCAGCGKGWWMDTINSKCHPCGPGYFNDKEASSDCVACPLMYSSAPWTAKHVDDCFDVDLPESILHRQILEGLLTPTIFLLAMLLLTIILSKIAINRETAAAVKTSIAD